MYFQDQKHRIAIIFRHHLPERYRRVEKRIKSEIKDIPRSSRLNRYISARVYVLARSPNEAAENALNALDLVRGIWNFFCNKRSYQRISHTINPLTHKPLPVNKILLGPVHSLIRLSRRSADSGRWLLDEPRYSEVISAHESESDMINEMYDFFLDTRHRLRIKKSDYRHTLEEAIVQYTRALDERDWYNAFLRLWIVLESLTHVQHDNYKVLMRRASFIFGRQEYYKQLLIQLKDYRNRFVHGYEENAAIETLMYQLKLFVEQLLLFHLGHRFKSLSEACKLLDLPSDKDILRSQIQLREYATKFLEDG